MIYCPFHFHFFDVFTFYFWRFLLPVILTRHYFLNILLYLFSSFSLWLCELNLLIIFLHFTFWTFDRLQIWLGLQIFVLFHYRKFNFLPLTFWHIDFLSFGHLRVEFLAYDFYTFFLSFDSLTLTFSIWLIPFSLFVLGCFMYTEPGIKLSRYWY